MPSSCRDSHAAPKFGCWVLVLLALGAGPGCSRWAYGPTWKGVDRGEGVALKYEGTSKCGELTVTNDTAAPLAVLWSEVHVRTLGGDRRRTQPWTTTERPALSDQASLAPHESRTAGLCTDLRYFVVKPRPPTGFDFALGWFFGMGVLAGNVAWTPDTERRNRIVDTPRKHGWDLVVPVRDEDGRRKLTLEVNGDGTVAFKYTPRVHGAPEALERRR